MVLPSGLAGGLVVVVGVIVRHGENTMMLVGVSGGEKSEVVRGAFIPWDVWCLDDVGLVWMPQPFYSTS